MQSKWFFLEAAVFSLLLAQGQAFFSEGNMRCRLFGINYQDCLNSVYRPMPAYDSFLNSFNVPVQKEQACGFSPCKIALLGSGATRFLSVAQTAHPPGDCLCLGITSCGCEMISDVHDHQHPLSPPEPAPYHPPRTHTVSIGSSSVQVVTHTVQVVSTVRVTETPAVSTVVQVQSVPLALPPVATPAAQASAPPKPSDAAPGNSAPAGGHIITIPYSTVLKTVEVTVPAYKTVTRSQYFVNTVDSYITQTMTLTKTRTVTKLKTRTQKLTVTETVSDHIERTRFSTVYVPSVKTVNNTKMLTVFDTTTKVLTATLTATPQPTPAPAPSTAPQPPAPAPPIAPQRPAPAQAPYKRHKKRPARPQAPPMPAGFRQPQPNVQALPQPQPQPQAQPQPLPQPAQVKYVVVKTVKKKEVCRPMVNGCIDVSKVMSGACEIGPRADASTEKCTPPRQLSGALQITDTPAPKPQDCSPNCDTVVKTVYVRATPTNRA
ncbi:hypothetical protein NEDG_01149 [Nematocida displodere]|uniref:Uncharacterized protein n=1 Tax=Nematocida displodere TaxID=1805483 RepID=A0A177EC96_9MICR|nr:hypothetical protein NEDG_01149 [Nematocida displodere]